MLRKALLVFIVLILVLCGCSPSGKNKLDQTTEERAVSFALDYLNNEHGYDLSHKYEIICHQESKDNEFPLEFDLQEDGKSIYKFLFIFSSEPGIGGLHYEYNGGFVSMVPFGPEQEFTVDAGKIDLTGKFVLEEIDTNELNDPYASTTDENREKLKQYVHILLPEIKDGDKITIYEKIHYVVLDVNAEKKAFIREREVIDFPVTVNDSNVYIMSVSPDYEAVMGSRPADGENDAWVKALKEGKPFLIVAAGKLYYYKELTVTSDTDLNNILPMIMRKCAPQIKDILAGQQPNKILAEFTFSEQ